MESYLASYNHTGYIDNFVSNYDTPVIKEHNNQSISTQDNVAYGGTIPLKQNEAYDQVHAH